jgi:hypothetical protein
VKGERSGDGSFGERGRENDSGGDRFAPRVRTDGGCEPGVGDCCWGNPSLECW